LVLWPIRCRLVRPWPFPALSCLRRRVVRPGLLCPLDSPRLSEVSCIPPPPNKTGNLPTLEFMIFSVIFYHTGIAGAVAFFRPRANKSLWGSATCVGHRSDRHCPSRPPRVSLTNPRFLSLLFFFPALLLTLRSLNVPFGCERTNPRGQGFTTSLFPVPRRATFQYGTKTFGLDKLSTLLTKVWAN